MSRFLALAFLAAPLTLGAQSTANPVEFRSATELQVAHQRILDELNTKDPTGALRTFDDPRVAELLRTGWQLAGEWAANFLNKNTPSKQSLEKIFDGFTPEPKGQKSKYGDFREYWFRGNATKVNNSLYVVAAQYGVDFPSGTFMVVARRADGPFQARWNIKDLALQHFESRDEIGRWAHMVSRAYYNGPLNVSRVVPLPPNLNGSARFAIDAFQAADGGTILGQFSIWQWNGNEAIPLLIDTYSYSSDFSSFKFDGSTFHIITKGNLVSAYSCGMCAEPAAIWIVQVTSRGVKDLGRHFVKPEYQWADALLSTIARGEDTSKLASPQVSTAIKKRIAEGAEENKTLGLAPEFSWGMLGNCRVLRRGQRGAFALNLDEGRLSFSYVMRNGKPYFTRVRIS